MTKETKKTAEETCSYLARLTGNNFREYREKKDISLRTIYKDINISAGVVMDYESGKKFPRMDNLIKLYEYVNIPLEEIFNPKILPAVIKNQRMGLFGNELQSDIDPNIELKNALTAKGYNGKEIEDIIQYAEFVKHKRS